MAACSTIAAMRAVILSIGDELSLGQTLDTNSRWIAERLVRHGVWPAYHLTLPDDRAAIAAALRQAAAVADLVVVTGGLGPTEDDLTRHALAEAMGVDLVEDAASLVFLQEFFAKRARAMPDANRRQALHPAGARVIPNTCGTAPGIDADLGGARVIVTPGVPREMEAMFAAAVLPLIIAGDGTVILTTRHPHFRARRERSGGAAGVADGSGAAIRRWGRRFRGAW